MAGPDDGWEDVTDPKEVPPEIRKTIGVAGVREALGIDADADAKDGGKAVPQWAKKDFEKSLTPFSQIDRALAGFKDDFAGNTITGDLENSIQGRFGSFGSSGQRDWWSQVRTADNQIRNELFGASLTAAEQRAYERTTISPDLDPKIVRENLKSRRDILAAATARQYKFLQAQGYSKDAIQALAGDYVTTLDPSVKAERDAALQAAKGGDQQSGAAGVVAGGSGAPPAGPAGGGGPGEVVFNDQAPAQVAEPLKLEPAQTAAMQALVQSGASAEAIAALAKSFGANVSPENAAALQKFYSDPKNRTIAPEVNVDNEVKAIDPGDGSVGAFARGITSNVPFSREIAAGIETIADPSSTLSQNLDEEYGKRKFVEDNNGTAYTLGAVAGSLPLGGIEFAGAREAARAAGLAAVRAGTPVAQARALANRVFATRTAAEAAGMSGIYAAGNADGSLTDRLGAGAVGAAAGAALGGAAAYGGSRFARALAARRAARAPAAASEQQQVLAAAERQNIVPFPADVGGAVTRRATSAAAQTIGGAGPIVRGAQTTLDSAEAVRNRVAAAIGTAQNPEAAGEVARAGAQAFIARTGQRIGRIYDAAGAAAGQARITTPEAVRVLDQELAPLAESPVQGPGVAILQSLRESLDQPQTVRGLRQMRTLIRDEFESASLRGSNIERIAGRVVDAATDDIVNGLRAQGLDRAATQYRVADRMWRERLATIDDHLEPILGGNAPKSGEQVVQALQSAMKGNNRRFAGFIQALPENEQATVRASLIQRLGRATKGNQDQDGEVFSLSSFLTHWDDIGERAKHVLFGDEGRAALNDLARYANGSKLAQRYANHSNTGGAIGNLATGATITAGLPALATTLAAQYGAGRLLASPRFARWLARPPRQATPAVTQAYVERLTRIARSEPAIAADVLNLQRRLTEAFGTAPTRLAAEERDRGGAPVEGQDRQPAGPKQGLQP